jgi:hypothetical protein
MSVIRTRGSGMWIVSDFSFCRRAKADIRLVRTAPRRAPLIAFSTC